MIIKNGKPKTLIFLLEVLRRTVYKERDRHDLYLTDSTTMSMECRRFITAL